MYVISRISLLKLDEDEKVSSYGAEHTGESGRAYVKEAKSIKLWHQIQPMFHCNNISFTSLFLRQLTESDYNA